MRASLLALSSCLPVIHGCSSDGAVDPAAGWGAVLKQIEEVNKVRCPELDRRDLATLKARTLRPAEWPAKGASDADLKAHINRHEVAEAAKIAAAGRVVAEHARCRGGDPAVPKVS